MARTGGGLATGGFAHFPFGCASLIRVNAGTLTGHTLWSGSARAFVDNAHFGGPS